MDEISKQESDRLLLKSPGGIVKLAFDEMLTILYTTDVFYSLIKNVADKMIVKAPLALLKLVYSADIIYVTQQIASQKHRKDNMFSINFRILQQDGSFKWVMINGNRTEETYQSGPKTVPIYYCTAMDITELMIKYKKLEQTIDYHNKIIELSKELFFEYEIATDTLSFNELFGEVFGKESVIKGFRNKLEETKIIYKDQLPAVISIYNNMMRGRKQARFKLKLIQKDGEACWYYCYASIIFDENKNPYKVVGKLSLTNHVEEDKEEYQPQTDALTKVFNKESAEHLIMEAVKKQKADTRSALFLIDLRNYKSMNEIRKSLSRENVLTEIGDLLIKNFRTTDIIGRLGLSEFVVYMKNISSDVAIYEMAEKLCRMIEEAYSYSYTKNVMSISIGIAVHKGIHDYQLLMANASAALVMAKKVTTSSFEVFNQTI